MCGVSSLSALSHLFALLCRAVTEAGSDHETPEPAKDVAVLLAPLLAPRPPSVSSQSGIHAHPPSSTPAQSAPQPSAASASQTERAEVQKFIDQQQVNSGLYAVAAGLLQRLLSQDLLPLSLEVLEEVMRLEAAVQGVLCFLTSGCPYLLMPHPCGHISRLP